MPLQSVYDHIACACDEVDIGHDDHLAEISVPILYIGAAGGTGTVGDYSSSLTASVDITNYNVSIPGADPASDYGHADLWFGYEANELVWSVLRDWLLNHTAHSLLP